jgi:hypothetical protein
MRPAPLVSFAPISHPRPRRRFLGFALLVGLAAPAAGAGLAWHRGRQAEDAVARLQRAGASVTERIDAPGWWLSLPSFARYRALKGLFGRKAWDVLLYGRGATADSLRATARLPGLYGLRVYDAPALDDDALAAVSGCTGVEILELRTTRVTDAGLRHLGGWLRLRWVTVRGSPVTDAGLRFLLTLPSVDHADYETTDPAEAVVRDLTVTGAGGARLEVGAPVFIGGRLTLNAARARAAGPVRVDVDVDTAGQDRGRGSASLTPDASHEAAFCVRVQERLPPWTVPGRFVASVAVELPGRPRVTYRLPPVVFDIRPPQGGG